MKTQQPTLKVSLKTHGRGCMLSKCFRTKYICICFLLPKNCVERKQVENHTIQWLDSNQTKLVWMVGGSGVWKINVSQRGDWGSIVLLNINCWSQLNGLWHRQPVNTVIIGWCEHCVRVLKALLWCHLRPLVIFILFGTCAHVCWHFTFVIIPLSAG